VSKKTSSIFALCLLVILAVPSFPQAPKQPAAKAEPVDEPPPVLWVPPDYRYDTAGRRDPFANPISQTGPEKRPDDPGAGKSEPRPLGLPGLLLAEAKLSGVITSTREPAMNRAVILGPGGKTYFATRGDSLFDAVIKEIRSDSTVVFTIVSRSNKQPTDREVIRAVSSSAGENK
jgi:hypothetical protein